MSTIVIPGVENALQLELDISQHGFRICLPGHQRAAFDFPHEIDSEGVVAQWSRERRCLTIQAKVACSVEVLEPTHSIGGLSLTAKDAFDPTHISTSLMLSWLQDAARDPGLGVAPGARVLDYGCGTGVLGLFALAHCGASHVVAMDVDVLSLAATKANAARNGLACVVDLRTPAHDGLAEDVDELNDTEALALRRVDLGAQRGLRSRPKALEVPDRDSDRFDLVLANMRKRPLLRNAGRLVARCRRGVRPGVLVVSGFMTDFEEREVIAGFRHAGLRVEVDLDGPSFEEMGHFRAQQGFGLFWGRPL